MGRGTPPPPARAWSPASEEAAVPPCPHLSSRCWSHPCTPDATSPSWSCEDTCPNRIGSGTACYHMTQYQRHSATPEHLPRLTGLPCTPTCRVRSQVQGNSEKELPGHAVQFCETRNLGRPSAGTREGVSCSPCLLKSHKNRGHGNSCSPCPGSCWVPC